MKGGREKWGVERETKSEERGPQSVGKGRWGRNRLALDSNRKSRKSSLVRIRKLKGDEPPSMRKAGDRVV